MVALAYGILKSSSLSKKMNEIGEPDVKKVIKVGRTFS